MPSANEAPRSRLGPCGLSTRSSSSLAPSRRRSGPLRKGATMAATQTASRVGPYVERLLENSYAQEQLGEAVESLRAAYQRASKRRVEPTRDEKLRRQIRQAALSITEAGH